MFHPCDRMFRHKFSKSLVSGIDQHLSLHTITNSGWDLRLFFQLSEANKYSLLPRVIGSYQDRSTDLDEMCRWTMCCDLIDLLAVISDEKNWG